MCMQIALISIWFKHSPSFYTREFSLRKFHTLIWKWKKDKLKLKKPWNKSKKKKISKAKFRTLDLWVMDPARLHSAISLLIYLWTHMFLVGLDTIFSHWISFKREHIFQRERQNQLRQEVDFLQMKLQYFLE